MARKRNGNHQQESTAANQSILPLALQSDDHLTISELETWLWDAACVIRGTSDAPKYKDFILPLIFYKRLSDVFDDEFQQHVELYGSEELAYEVIMADHQKASMSLFTNLSTSWLPTMVESSSSFYMPICLTGKSERGNCRNMWKRSSREKWVGMG